MNIDAPQRSDSAKGARQRARILEAAAGQFLAHGFAAASVRAIAKDAGTQPSTLYYYYTSKEDLLVAVHAEGMQRIQDAVSGALSDDDEPWDRLETACVAHLEALLEGGVIFQAVMREMPSALSAEAMETIRRMRDGYELIFVRLLDDLALPRGTDRHDLRLMLLGALNWSFSWYRPGRNSPAELARTYVKYLRNGLDLTKP